MYRCIKRDSMSPVTGGNTMKKLTTFVLLAAIAALPATALARHRPGHRFGPPAGHKILVKQAMQKAGLSDGQIRSIETLRDEAQREVVDIRHEIEKARLDFEQLMKVDSPNEAAVMDQLEKIHALRLKLAKNRVKLLLDVRKEMTPAQWEKLQAIRAERRIKRRKRIIERRRSAGEGMQPRRGMGSGMDPGMGMGPGLGPDLGE